MDNKTLVLFLSHHPHQVHLEFAGQIKARISIIPLGGFVRLAKKCSLFRYFYPVASLFYSFTLKLEEKIILVDGGSSLYIAFFLKLRYPKIKIVYLDADLFILNLRQANILEKKFKKLILSCVDAVISVSAMNSQAAAPVLNVPLEICPPYPAKIRPVETERRNYGLYVGRLDPDKNIKRILRIGLACPDLEKIIIVGEGVLENYVRAQAKKYDKLRYDGPQRDVSRYYSQCKFLIHLADKDPHPCTTMEAAQGGCFPIISEGTGTKYLFDDIFIVNDPDNSAEINEKIKYILEHETEARKLLEQSLPNIMSKEQSLKNFKDKFEKILNQLNAS